MRPTPGDRHPVPPYQTPRLRLKPKARPSGYVDGAWWPRSNELTAELPDLLAVLSVRLGAIGRVLYNLDEWPKAPVKFATGGGLVRLDGFQNQPAHTLEVLGVNRSNVVLLVVSPNADTDHAHSTMMAAAAPDDDTSVAGLLGISAGDGADRLRIHAGHLRRRGR
ncbi:hypothetical protein AWB95_20725 [Mycobacterium celatum]|nr:hypothetical protein AWB95_20725 [Mycobacterium celatum]